VVVELARQFSDSSADRLLILAQFEVHTALRSTVLGIGLSINCTNGQTKMEGRLLSRRSPSRVMP
jgi:hypothetical protein